jgi:hypothetical protein
MVTEWEYVVASQSKVIEAGGIAPPSRRFGLFDAHHVGRGAHLNASEAEGPLDQRYFKLDGGAHLDLARREEVNPARTDVPRDESNRNEFFDLANASQA